MQLVEPNKYLQGFKEMELLLYCYVVLCWVKKRKCERVLKMSVACRWYVLEFVMQARGWCCWKCNCCIAVSQCTGTQQYNTSEGAVQVVEPNKYWASMAVKGRIKINKLWLPNTLHYNEQGRGPTCTKRTVHHYRSVQYRLPNTLHYKRGKGPNKIQNTITVCFNRDYETHTTRRRRDHNTQYTDHLIHILSHFKGPNIFWSYYKGPRV